MILTSFVLLCMLCALHRTLSSLSPHSALSLPSLPSANGYDALGVRSDACGLTVVATRGSKVVAAATVGSPLRSLFNPCALPRRALLHAPSAGLLFTIWNVTGGVVGGVPPSSMAGHSGANGKAPPPPPPRFGSGNAELTQQPSPPFGQQVDWRQHPQEQRVQEQQEQRDPPPAKLGVFRRVLPWLFLLCLLVFVVAPVRAYFRLLRQGSALPYESRLKRRAVFKEMLKRMGREELLQQGDCLAYMMHYDIAARITLFRAQMGVGVYDTLEEGEEAAAALLAHARPELRMEVWRAVAFYVLLHRAVCLLVEVSVTDEMIAGFEQEEKWKERSEREKEENKRREEERKTDGTRA